MTSSEVASIRKIFREELTRLQKTGGLPDTDRWMGQSAFEKYTGMTADQLTRWRAKRENVELFKVDPATRCINGHHSTGEPRYKYTSYVYNYTGWLARHKSLLEIN